MVGQGGGHTVVLAIITTKIPFDVDHKYIVLRNTVDDPELITDVETITSFAINVPMPPVRTCHSFEFKNINLTGRHQYVRCCSESAFRLIA